MGVQSAINQSIGAIGGGLALGKRLRNEQELTKKVSDLGSEYASKVDFQNLTAAQAFQKAEQSLANEYYKKVSNNERALRLHPGNVAITGRIGDLGKQAELHESAASQTEEYIQGELAKLGKGTTVSRGE